MLIMFLCACGTKGPLYIPEERYPQDSKFEDSYFKTQDIA